NIRIIFSPTALLLSSVLWYLNCQTNLKSPEDIQVYVVNSNFTLRWNYTGNDTNVTFSAEFFDFRIF
uniref:Uncharacterized protein n=1 Tax=Otus sunia TaxID=257818 RepID=A0A8C8BHQ0_9STRI